jgi:hypothetical protein
MKQKNHNFDTILVFEAESQAMLNTNSRMHYRMAEALGTVHIRGRGLFGR